MSGTESEEDTEEEDEFVNRERDPEASQSSDDWDEAFRVTSNAAAGREMHDILEKDLWDSENADNDQKSRCAVKIEPGNAFKASPRPLKVAR